MEGAVPGVASGGRVRVASPPRSVSVGSALRRMLPRRADYAGLRAVVA